MASSGVKRPCYFLVSGFAITFIILWSFPKCPGCVDNVFTKAGTLAILKPSIFDGAADKDFGVPEDSNVLKMDLTPPLALKLVRGLAMDSCRVAFTTHVGEQMAERGITTTQVFCCLKKGLIIEGPARNVRGSWEMRLEVPSAGDIINVVIVLDHDKGENLIIIKTAFIV